MINIIKKYLEQNNYAGQKESFKDSFLSHPNYPSFFAITDTFDLLHIENIVVKIPKEQFIELPDSFLVLFEENLVLVSKKSNGVIIENEKGEKKNITFNEFLTGWDEIVIAVEPNNEKVTENGLSDGKWLYYSLPVLTLIILSLFFKNHDVISIVHLLISIMGLIVSILIVSEKLGIKNELTSKFCNLTPNTSCDSVIKSNKSAINKWADFSDLPLLFFGGCIFSILLNPQLSSVVGLLSLLSMPIVAYSIWLQKFQLKKWCVLCLAISSIILLQGIVFWFPNPSFQNLFSINLFEFIFFLILFGSAWLLVKPVLKKKMETESQVNELKRFKRNYSIFKSLAKEITSPQGFEHLKGLQFGNLEADTKLSIILSPSCGHCHKAFEDGFELASKFPGRFFLNVLFNVNPENDQNPYKTVVQSLLAINNSNPDKVAQAISDWHIQKMDLDVWKLKWEVTTMDMKANQQIHQQYDWCTQNGFNYTPVKIINGKLFPNEYEISELKYFLNDFAAENETTDADILVPS
ncbi:MAG: vitamin K epoxide reductase family protein [Flavobacterium sp.]